MRWYRHSVLIALIVVFLTACVPIVLRAVAKRVVWPAIAFTADICCDVQPLAFRALVFLRAPPRG